MESPMYKEKLRLRSYGVANKSTPVFLEIKKKFDSVVYKRRVITRRIIIAPGYMLSEEVEYLIECLDMDRFIMFIRFNERLTGSFVKGLSMIAPELHIENYDSPVDAFKLAYSSRYKSSLREFLLFFLIY